MPKGIYPRKPPMERFWSHVAASGPDDCWLWTAARDKDGYGKFSVRARRSAALMAHRFAYEAANGPIPDGLYVCHSCDNPPCCNPAHLWLGTNQDNQLDAVAKGRITFTYVTHCKRGHEYTVENTYWNGTRRFCRACNRLAAAQQRKRRAVSQ